MKEMILINASPRTKGTSVVLLQMCKAYLEANGHETRLIHLYPAMRNADELWKAIKSADTIIFSGPCYINTYPADTVAFLQELSTHKELLHGQSLYGIIQGGMPYVHTHESGLSLLEIFCRKCNLSYKGGFVMGMGAMLNGQPVSKLLNSKTVLKQLNVFFEHIEKDEVSLPEVYQKAQIKLPSLLFHIMSKIMNRKIDQDLKKHGIDVKQISPYME